MLKMSDTIVAVGTPQGRGALSIIRISGEKSLEFLKKRFKTWKATKRIHPDRIYFGYFYDTSGNELDEVGIIYYKSPNSFTGEDMAEIICHGSPVVVSEIVDTVIRDGARIAHRGEFSERRFLNGKIDLTQAEAINDLINSTTVLQAKIAESMLKGSVSRKIIPLKDRLLHILVELETEVEFSEEGVKSSGRKNILSEIEKILEDLKSIKRNFKRSSFIKEGINLCIVGKPNVGKSSLFNQLIKEERAIVSHVPGTTRDYIVEASNISGIPVKITDTAGIREAFDEIESEGIKRSYKKMEDADLILLVIDVSRGQTSDTSKDEDIEVIERYGRNKVFVVFNKIDLPDGMGIDEFVKKYKIKNFWGTSAKYGIGIEGLKNKIYEILVGEKIEENREILFITSKRQQRCILDAIENIENGITDLLKDMPEEYISYHLRKASESLSEIFGEMRTEDILNEIFSTFCIGK